VTALAPSRFVEPAAAAKLAVRLAGRPASVRRRVVELGTELARIGAGTSSMAPALSDRRFTDRAWSESWLHRRLLQSYLALHGTVDGLIDDAELDWRTERLIRFMLGNTLDALAPTNFPFTNPTVLKEIVDRGGANFVKGARQFVRDVSKRRLPAMVDTDSFDVGGNLAVTPGAVVLRTDVFELLQYKPRTAEVYETPLLVVPPTINKYYVLDLAPERSFVEFLVSRGHQVFMVSWRNPDHQQGHFDFDTYAAAILQARAAASEISRHNATHLVAACSGGIIAAGTAGHLAASKRLGELASLTLLVAALDQARAGTAAAFATKELAAASVARSARRGYLEGQALARGFAWLRPNDLIWRHVVNNYLLGKDPPALDILYWNEDTVHLAAGLHRDFVELALDNGLTRPGGFSVLGDGIDLRRVDLATYIVAGASDHIVPWPNAYRTTQLLAGERRFVLSSGGHVQAMVNPASSAGRSSFQIADDHPPDAEKWQQQAVTRPGSWWTDYVDWLAGRSGERKAAPRKLGSATYRAHAKAPGTYVHA
jgi:polyhydroxyalkanoate synthase